MKHGWFSPTMQGDGVAFWRTPDGLVVGVTLVTGNRRRPVRAPEDLVCVGPVVEFVRWGGQVAAPEPQEEPTAPEPLGVADVADECCASECCRAARALATRLLSLHARC